MGAPSFAAPSLRLLAAHHDVTSVLTQPDRPAGRGMKPAAPPVKVCARELGLAVDQPASIKTAEAFERLDKQSPDVIAVVGYGRIVPQRIIELPRHGCVNVHSSLLPRYRGAAPIHWALAAGETTGGVSTMLIAEKLDAGDILLQRATPIGPDETASELGARLAPMGAELLLETLDALEAGSLRPVPQDHEKATYAPVLKREDGRVDWRQSARQIYNRLRGFDPWPGIFSTFRGKRLRIHAARPSAAGGLAPGETAFAAGSLFAGCGAGRLELLEVQIEGKKRIAAADFARGYRLGGQEILGS